MMLDFIKRLTGDISSLISDGKKVYGEIQEKKKRFEYLLYAPVCRDDVIVYIKKQMKLEADLAPKHFKAVLESIIRKPDKDLICSANRELGLPVLTASAGGYNQTVNSKILVSFLGAEIIEKGIENLVSKLPDLFENAGPPMSERKPEIEKLEIEIPALENEYENLRKSAESAGIDINKHMPAMGKTRPRRPHARPGT